MLRGAAVDGSDRNQIISSIVMVKVYGKSRQIMKMFVLSYLRVYSF